MTEQIPAQQPAPVADAQPVPVHITSIKAGLQLGPAPAPRRRRASTRFSTYVLTTTNPLQNILPEAPDRIRAVITVHAAVAGAGNSGAYGWLARTQGAAASAARDKGEDTTESAAYISAGVGYVEFEFWGQNAVWAALDNGATVSMTITVISDYEAA